MNKRPINLNGLRGFLAAARHQSFTRAAAELHLTQSALSRQIAGLEDELATPLFVRTTRQVALTPAGQRLAQVAARAIGEIDGAVNEMRPSGGVRPLTVTTFASFASLWLIPRLEQFSRLQPDVDVHCMASDRAIDLDHEGFDIACRAMTRAHWPDDGLALFDEQVVPVASPALLAASPIDSAADLTQQTLLAFESAHDAIMPMFGWPHWFEARGLRPVKPKRMLRFSNHDQVIQAALAGQGIALARAALISETLREKRLLPILGGPIDPQIRYFLLISTAARHRPEVQAFADWAAEEAAGTRKRLASFWRAAKDRR